VYHLRSIVRVAGSRPFSCSNPGSHLKPHFHFSDEKYPTLSDLRASSRKLPPRVRNRKIEFSDIIDDGGKQMKRLEFSESQIVAMLKQGEAGRLVAEILPGARDQQRNLLSMEIEIRRA
jgi:hypothetical protein